ncbi:MAG: filamentous hemagglutinin N-terminal domain-containing protein [Methylophilaceae bacterium]|nr:MAG: filamentous hemagglutinin N-terminal domain-containing protein [Methylophilaceae bacterium]
MVALGATSLGNVVAAPAGGQVTAGTGTISQTGNTTTINQSTQNLSLSWSQFNVAPQEIVNFVQPSSASIAVNRILSTNGSQILGQINANGQVYLINPNGILFGQGAQVNVGGLVASTLNISDTSLTGSIRSFSGNGTGSVINQGSINTPEGGYVALLGNTVSNQGAINSPTGTVALGAGSAATLTFDNNNLVQMQIDQSTLNNLAENKQLIKADGGAVIMSAGAKDSLLASVVNNSGVISAQTLQNKNGVITLLAGTAAGTTNVGGTLDTSRLNLGPNSYTVITSASALQDMTAGTNYALGRNIDLTSTPFTPIASFNSIFDGLGHTISNLSITGGANTGLFANVSGATIQNVGLVNGTVTGAASTGALVGNMASTTINNSYAQNIIVTGAAGTGGLVGTVVGTGNINNSYATGSVIGSGAATGGLVGSTAAVGSITNSCASGDVQGDGAGTGGLVGSSASSGSIISSYATGNVMSVAAGTGGLVGSNASGAIFQSFASGNVNGGGAGTGGLAGSNMLGLISQSFAVGNVSGTGWSLAAPAPTAATVGASTGGLVGSNSGAILNSYSSGNVTGYAAGVGGLVGSGAGTVTTSFSSGIVTGTAGATSVGGGTVTTGNGIWGVGANNNPILVTINKTLTLSNTTLTKVYDGTAYIGTVSLTASCCVSMMTVSLPGLSSDINAGVYSVTPSLTLTNVALAPFFTVAPVTLTVSPLALTGGAISGATSVYGSATTLGTLSFNNVPTSGSAVVDAVSLVSPTYSTSGNVNAGSYNQTAAASTTGNYTFAAVTSTANNVVSPAFLVITVNDSTKVFGTTADLSIVGFTSAGLVNGETISSVVLTSPGAVNTALVANYSITANTLRGNSAFLASNYLVSDIDGTMSVIATTPIPTIPTTTPDITTTKAPNSNPANTAVYLQSSVQSSLKTAKDDFVYQAISSNPLLVNTNLNSIETSNNWTTAYWNSSIQIFNNGINTSLSEDNVNAH